MVTTGTPEEVRVVGPGTTTGVRAMEHAWNNVSFPPNSFAIPIAFCRAKPNVEKHSNGTGIFSNERTASSQRCARVET
jgi:hypothetical protein